MVELASTSQKPGGACDTPGATWKVLAPMPSKRTTRGCKVEECDRKHYGRGYCAFHYRRWRLYGDPHYWAHGTPEERFWSKIDQTDSCWNWTGTLNNRGYGQFFVDRRQVLAHRFSYEYHIGPIPTGVFCLHRCDNRRCVNPEHLFLGDVKDNYDDMIRKGRGAVGSRHPLAKLTEKDVRDIRARFATGNDLIKDIATDYEVSPSLVGMIVRGKKWKHVETEWRG